MLSRKYPTAPLLIARCYEPLLAILLDVQLCQLREQTVLHPANLSLYAIFALGSFPVEKLRWVADTQFSAPDGSIPTLQVLGYL